MIDSGLFVPLAVVGTAAVLFFPGMMIAYRVILIRQRLDEIETNIWTEKAIDAYVRLFTKATPEEWRERARRRSNAKFGPLVRWTDGALDAYQWLFTRTTREERRARRTGTDFGSIVRCEFLRVHSWKNYLASVIPVTIVVAAIVWTCCSWVDARVSGSDASVGRLDDAVILAMAGAYTWSVYEILSRFRSRDLTPEDLLEMMLRHVAAVPLGYAFSLLAIDRVAASMAFVSAAFPLREVRLIVRQRALKKLELEPRANTSSEGRIGKVLDGISDVTIVRLEELQIVTYLDLAYVNPVWLMARTGVSLRHILAWTDQALLAVYAPHLKKKLTRAGLPCALDAREFYLQHCFDRSAAAARDWNNDPAVIELARMLEVPIVIVPEILQRVDADPHVRFLADIWYSEVAEPVSRAVVAALPARA